MVICKRIISQKLNAGAVAWVLWIDLTVASLDKRPHSAHILTVHTLIVHPSLHSVHLQCTYPHSAHVHSAHTHSPHSAHMHRSHMRIVLQGDC